MSLRIIQTLQLLPPELLVTILSYCDYTTNSNIKTLNSYFYNFYHAYFDHIIKAQYNIHPSSIKQLYSLITKKNETHEPIQKLLWIKGTQRTWV